MIEMDFSMRNLPFRAPLLVCALLSCSAVHADEASVKKALNGLLSTYSPVGKDTGGFEIDNNYQLKQHASKKNE